jgi:hypothetical protein
MGTPLIKKSRVVQTGVLQRRSQIPHNVLHEILPHLNTTEMERGTIYWHIHITQNTTVEYAIIVPKREENLLISPYAIDLGAQVDDPANAQ